MYTPTEIIKHPDLEGLKKAAMRIYVQGDWDEANRRFEYLLAEYKKKPGAEQEQAEMHLYMGLICFQKGEFQNINHHFKEIKKLIPQKLKTLEFDQKILEEKAAILTDAKKKESAEEYTFRTFYKNTGAQDYVLARRYEKGIGVKKDLLKAVQYYQRAADQNHSAAQYHLGRCYENSIGVAKDMTKAVMFYQRAAAQNDPNARKRLVFLYDNKIIETANLEFQFNLGLFYLEGVGVEKDLQKAMGFFLRTADLGLKNAQCALGLCYQEGIGVDIDLVKSLEWYSKAEKLGTEPIGKLFTLMSSVFSADVKSSSIPEDKPAASITNLNSLSEAKAQFEEGACLWKQDKKEAAIDLYQAAAEKGYPPAQFNMGVLRQKKDPSLAVYCYWLAAEQGYAKAAYQIGLCYEKGIGVEPDISEAFYWYDRAAAQGHQEAIERCEKRYDSEAPFLNRGAILLNEAAKQNDKTAKKEIKRLALEANHPLAQLYMGECYENGLWETIDLQEAENYYSRVVQHSDEAIEDTKQKAIKALQRLESKKQAKIESKLQPVSTSAAEEIKTIPGKPEIALHPVTSTLVINSTVSDADSAEQCAAPSSNQQQVLDHLNKCQACLNTGKFEDILTHLKEIANLIPEKLTSIQNILKEKAITIKDEEQKEYLEESTSEALQKSPHREYILARRYEKGIGVEKNLIEAVQLYHFAADRNHPAAQYYLGLCYENGIGVTIDDGYKALEYYQYAARQKHPGARKRLVLIYETLIELGQSDDQAQAEYNLGLLYQEGIGVKKDLEKSIKLYRSAAEKKEKLAQYVLGSCYEKGIGVKIDLLKSMEWYGLAAQQGDLRAQEKMTNLLTAFHVEDVQGFLMPAASAPQAIPTIDLEAKAQFEQGGQLKDQENLMGAASCYQVAADLGYASAQFNIGAFYHGGLGGIEQNKFTAVYWYWLAAEQGYKEAEYQVGLCYEKGIGVKPDIRESFYWYDRAAAHGDVKALEKCNQGYPQNISPLDPEARLQLGRSYQSKKILNPPEAVRWYRLAANQNFPQAQFNLGTCYEKGDGIERDLSKAIFWYYEAAKGNHQSAKDKMDCWAMLGNAQAQLYVGECYEKGILEKVSLEMAVNWYDLAVKQSDERIKIKVVKAFERLAGKENAAAECHLGLCYEKGEGIEKDEIRALQLYKLANKHGNTEARAHLTRLGKAIADKKTFEAGKLSTAETDVEIKASEVSNVTVVEQEPVVQEKVKEQPSEAGTKKKKNKPQKQPQVKPLKIKTRPQSNQIIVPVPALIPSTPVVPEPQQIPKENNPFISTDVHLDSSESGVEEISSAEVKKFSIHQQESEVPVVPEPVKDTFSPGDQHYLTLDGSVNDEKESKTEPEDPTIEKDPVGYWNNLIAEEGEAGYKKILDRAQGGNRQAQFILGVIAEHQQNFKDAVSWYQLAADQGHAASQCNLASCYEYGYGVEENLKEAVRLYRLAAKQGLPEAQFNLGTFYFYGVEARKSRRQAGRLYRLAADQGLAVAQFKLGELYFNGWGIEENAEEGERLYRSAAEGGHAEAQFKMAMLCQRNENKAVRKEAVHWHQLAAAQGHENAIVQLRYLKEKNIQDAPGRVKQGLMRKSMPNEAKWPHTQENDSDARSGKKESEPQYRPPMYYPYPSIQVNYSNYPAYGQTYPPIQVNFHGYLPAEQIYPPIQFNFGIYPGGGQAYEPTTQFNFGGYPNIGPVDPPPYTNERYNTEVNLDRQQCEHSNNVLPVVQTANTSRPVQTRLNSFQFFTPQTQVAIPALPAVPASNAARTRVSSTPAFFPKPKPGTDIASGLPTITNKNNAKQGSFVVSKKSGGF